MLKDNQIFVDACKINVTYIPVPDSEFYKIVPAIWHPAVLWPKGIIYKNDINQLKDISLSFSSPFNLNASNEYKKNRKLFDKKNEKIQSTFLDIKQDCSICFEDSCSKEYICFNLHWVCSQCRKNINSCPECRYIPFENRGRNTAIGYK